MVNTFSEYLKKSNPAVEIKGQAWPKLFEPDYTPQITAIMAANPQAIMTSLWGADLVTFIKQGAMYGLFEKVKLFSTHLGDDEIINSVTKTVGKFPAGLYARVRYLKTVPDTPTNREFYDTFVKRFNVYPLYWAWMNYLGAISIEAAVKKAGSVDNDKVIRALENLSVKGPGGVGPGETVTMRGRDHQLINYAEASGVTISQPPYLTNVVYASWDKLIEEESTWLKRKGWL
jgi:branched-chain amino acid transport system substrate-binding protein